MIIHYPFSTSYSYDPATIAYLGASASNYQQDRRIALNELIVGLKSSNLWTKIYHLMIYAAPSNYGYPGNFPDLSLATRNLKDVPGSGMFTYDPNSPFPAPFTPWRGFDLGQSPAPRLLSLDFGEPFGYYSVNSGPAILNTADMLNNFSFGFWSLTDSQSSGGDFGNIDYYNEYDFDNSVYVPQYPVGWGIYARDSADVLTYRVNSEFEYTVPNSNSKGLFLASRSSSSSMSISRNGVILATHSEPSKNYPGFGIPEQDRIVGQGGLDAWGTTYMGAVKRRPITLLYGTSYAEPSVLNLSNREYCLHWIGQGLTATEQADLFDLLKTYLLVLLPAADLGV